MTSKDLPKIIYANVRSNLKVLGSVLLSKQIQWEGDLEDVRGKRVLLLVHGVKNTEAQIKTAYKQLGNRSTACFDVVVGFIWPAGSTPLGWPIVSTIALLSDRTSDKLEEVIDEIYKYDPVSITINAHSLGCPIAIKAINRPIESLWLLSPAMTRYIGRYKNHFQYLTYPVQICYSKLDSALALYMAWPPFLPALGMFGEGGRTKQGVSHDFTKEIGTNHTGYRHSSKLYQLMFDLYKRIMT